MARKVSFSAMESRSARLNKFTIRRRPYSGPSLARGILLLYRRNKTNGTWVLKVSDGQGAYWTKGFALADDFEDADGKTVLTFHQAQEQAKKLARGGDGNAGRAQLVRRRPSAIGGGEDRDTCARCRRKAINIGAHCRCGHYTRPVVTAKYQGSLKGAGREDSSLRDDFP